MLFADRQIERFEESLQHALLEDALQELGGFPATSPPRMLPSDWD
jgi:hypothetical protein